MSYAFGQDQDEYPAFLPAPALVIPLAVWQQIMGYIQACPVEINGFGTLDRLGNELRVDNVFILEQVATAGSVEVSPEVLARHLTTMVQRGEDTSRIRFQWHSHVDMPAYFSGVDLNNIEAYAADWMVSLVANKRGEYQLRLDVYRPFRAWTPLELQVLTPADEDVIKACRQEITAKVRQHRLNLPGSKAVTPAARVREAFVGADSLYMRGRREH